MSKKKPLTKEQIESMVHIRSLKVKRGEDIGEHYNFNTSKTKHNKSKKK